MNPHGLAACGFLFLNALYLEEVRGLSAFHTGLCTLPLAIMMMICAPLSGRLVGHHGTLPSLLTAGAGFLTSTLLLTRLSVSTPLALLMLAYLLFGIGLARISHACRFCARFAGAGRSFRALCVKWLAGWGRFW